MILFLLSLLIAVVPFSSGGYPAVVETSGRPWPLPQSEIFYEGSLDVVPQNFIFQSTSNDCDILQDAYIRYYSIIFGSSFAIQDKEPKSRTGAELIALLVTLEQPCEQNPYLGMDESYTLDVCSPDNPTGAELTSTSVWGALRGLETFSQIILKTSDPNLFYINCTETSDFPRFSHRGILLDTSRHFLPTDILKENLDIMAMNKFNVFHWHIVDDESFPYESTYNPNLSNLGSYESDLVYSVSDVDDIIEYSRLRGIRVLVEFDTPGHVESWGPGQPGFLTNCYSNGAPDGTVGPVDPSNEDNYAFLDGFFQEVSSRFPDHYLHLGGDEVSFNCWKSNPNISDFMTRQGISGDYAALEEYYITRLIDIIHNLPNANGYIVWEEVFNKGIAIANDTVVNVWKGSGALNQFYQTLSEVTAAGYQTLLSSCWYLNYISYGVDWHQYYNCDPQGFDGTDAQKQLVMGGEACMWGEYVDESNLISRLWPRASAVAERLWSNANDTTSASAAESRLEGHRCLLVSRGVNAEPVNGPSYCKKIK